MKTAWLVVSLAVASAYASIVTIKGENKLADGTFLERQKKIFDLYVGISHNDYLLNKYSDFEPMAHRDFFADSKVPDNFWKAYQHGFLHKDGVFTLSCPYIREQTIYLFDLFFFAKDFESFYQLASWARIHVNPMQFAYTYTLALIHREDCRLFEIPPLYEIFPTYFVPKDTFQKIYNAKMYGIKEGKFYFNNTGYEYNYHTQKFGGPFEYDVYEPYLDNKVSYFREDIGANLYYTLWQLRYPAWMCPKKYNKSYWFKRGEGFYYTHQQLFARYSFERLANGLPYVEPLYWDKPIKTGYSPRIYHYNGHTFNTRPDNYEPEYFNKYYVSKAKTYEKRIYDAIHLGYFTYNTTQVYINNEDGIDALGKVIYGSMDKYYYNGYYENFYGSYYYTSLNALAYLVQTKDDHSYVGGSTSYLGTSMRDPAFYNYLNRLTGIFQEYKANFKPYTRKELGFPGVVVKNFDIDQLFTYFEQYDFEVTNALPLKDFKDYSTYKYYASQWRLSHKPFNYKIILESDNSYDAMVRVFIGPKYDSEEHILSLEQMRMLMVEFDRFPVKTTSGQNVFQRNSKDSPIYTNDYDGFRQMYTKVQNAIKSQEPYYIKEKLTCGVPERFQLPKGWKSGQPVAFYVVVSPFEKKYSGETKEFYTTCGSSKLYDYRPLGYPFDKPIDEIEWKVPNIYYKYVDIFHQSEYDMTPGF